MKISVIIPAYNEVTSIVGNVIEVSRALRKINAIYEIVIVDDGSTDNTYQTLHRFFYGYTRIKVVRNQHNLGKGAAIRKGLEEVTGEYVIFLDADLDIAPEQIRLLFDVMKLADADIVIGSKLHKCSIVNYPFTRRVVSVVYYYLVKYMIGIACHDTQTGIKLFRTKTIKSILDNCEIDRYAFDLEILTLLHRAGYKIAEAPVILKSRRKYNRIGFFSIFYTFKDTIRIWIKIREKRDRLTPILERIGKSKWIRL